MRKNRVLRRLLRNKLAVFCFLIVIAFVIIGLIGPYIAPYDPLEMDPEEWLTPHSEKHILGTDTHGRDMLSRLLYGARSSLMIGIISVCISMVTGSCIGFLGGYYDRLGSIIMRVIDIWLSFPTIITALTVVSVLGQGLDKLIIAIAFSQIPQFARLAYSLMIGIKEKEFVEAAKAIGVGDLRVIVRHILPNCVAPLIIQASILVPDAILQGSGLSFLGLGIQPPHPEWGSMIGSSREFLREAPYLMLYPGITLMLVVIGFNVFGDGVRDALDPKVK